ncbi:MAG: hypothetical protein U0264_03950 [Candidatus Kapaibacterium sp.]
MDIINYDNFYKLKLADFVSNKEDIQELEDWEFMNAIWNGESIGFTEWLQLTEGPKEKSISIDLNNLADSSIDKMFSTLKLYLTKGMSKENVLAQFGEPNNIESFVEDRVTFEYIIGSKEKYYLSLTITNDIGLMYVVLMNHKDTIKNLIENAST